MRVFAIDPGPTKSGYCLYSSDGVILDFGIVPNEQLIAEVPEPGIRIVVEMVNAYSMTVGTSIFETCVWIGRITQAFGPERVERLTRHQVKMHLCHTKQAGNPQIRQAMLDRFGPPGTKKAPGYTYGITSHAWSALALAVTYVETIGEQPVPPTKG